MLDRATSHQPLPATVTAAVRAGVDRIQLRERELEAAAWLEWANEIVAAARRGLAGATPGRRVEIVVNRRIDIAMAIDADGVHLGFDALDPTDARLLLPRIGAIGISAHTEAEVEKAGSSGATYAHLAPIWDPLSKPASRPALGLEVLARACRHGLPVIAQGGVTPPRCALAVRAGAAGVAVTGDILAASDPARATATLRTALDQAQLQAQAQAQSQAQARARVSE